MADEHYITQKEADEAKARPIVVAPSTARADSIAPYFVEEVRKDLEAKYGAVDPKQLQSCRTVADVEALVGTERASLRPQAIACRLCPCQWARCSAQRP